jgi:hypothetical protein
MKNAYIKTLAGISYAGMVAVNLMANSLPINGRLTGEVADSYPNLFVPAGQAFSIWGLIYFLLGAYVFYNFGNHAAKTEALLQNINLIFIATSLANILWIFAWHYDYIIFSTFIMVVLLFLLVKIANIICSEQFSYIQNIFIRAPFSIYFSWIIVASIANIVVFLVSIGWNRFGTSESLRTSIILLLGAMISIFLMLKERNVFYAKVFIWAYAWILFKHLSPNGFAAKYPSIIATVLICLFLYLFFMIRIFYKKDF